MRCQLGCSSLAHCCPSGRKNPHCPSILYARQSGFSLTGQTLFPEGGVAGSNRGKKSLVTLANFPFPSGMQLSLTNEKSHPVIAHIMDKWSMTAWLAWSYCCKSGWECLETASNPCVKSSSTLQHLFACWAHVMKLEKLVKLRTEVTNLESKIGKNMRICSAAPVWSNSDWWYFVLSWRFCHKRYRIRHTKAHVVL